MWSNTQSQSAGGPAWAIPFCHPRHSLVTTHCAFRTSRASSCLIEASEGISLDWMKGCGWGGLHRHEISIMRFFGFFPLHSSLLRHWQQSTFHLGSRSRPLAQHGKSCPHNLGRLARHQGYSWWISRSVRTVTGTNHEPPKRSCGMITRFIEWACLQLWICSAAFFCPAHRSVSDNGFSRGRLGLWCAMCSFYQLLQNPSTWRIVS